MAWCYYCRRYTVNGRCPVCNRMYEEPGKNYDFYGKEIKRKPEPKRSGKSSGESSYSDPLFARGFWLGIAINFGAIIIAKKTGRVRMAGAITGMVINSVLTLHILGILLTLAARRWGIVI